MASATEHNDVASGMWKFKDTVPVDTLLELAQEWKDGPDGDKYLELYVRQCSKDQFAIGFMYLFTPGESARKSYERFFYKMTDLLRRRFGNDFVGWDVSSTTWLIK